MNDNNFPIPAGFPNFTESTRIMEPSLSSGEIASIVVKLLIYIFGTLGNILVIFVILYLNEYKKITHWYVLQLAIADLMFLQTVAVSISVNIEQNWIHHESMCKAKEALLFINYYSSILFLMIMAIDRYLAVCHGFSIRVERLRQPKTSYIVAGVTWAVSVLLSIPIMMYSGLNGLSEANCRCEIRFPYDPRRWCEEQSYTNETEIKKCMKEDFVCSSGAGNICTSHSSVGSDPACNIGGIGGSGDGFNFNNTGIAGGNGLGGNDSSNTRPFPVINLDPFSSFPGGIFPFGGGNMMGGNGTNGTASTIGPGCVYSKSRPGFPAFLIFNFVVMFCVPLLVIIVCYGLIVLRLKTKMFKGSEAPSADATSSGTDGEGKIVKTKKKKTSSANRSTAEKKRVTVMCAVLVLLFVVCWLPFHAVHLAKINGIANVSSEYCGSLAVATSILAYLNSALNPYLYNFLGTFKKRIKQIRDHERTRTFLSATGLTRVGHRSSSVGNSNEGSRTKPSSTSNNQQSSVMPEEANPLTGRNETTNV